MGFATACAFALGSDSADRGRAAPTFRPRVLQSGRNRADTPRVMLHTQSAYAENYAASPYQDRVPAPRVVLGAELRLASVSAVISAIDRCLPAKPQRIELDASRLRFMTEGARRLLLVATARLAAREVELVIVGCEPFG